MSLEYARVGNIEDITSIGSTTSFLQATAADVRLTRVNWQSYVQGQIINTEQFNFITRLDNASTPEARDRVINEDRQLTARVFVFILSRISKEQTLQYILTLLDDILQEDKMRVEIFQDYFKDSKDALWSQFFTFFQRGDAFCTYQASRIIAKFACWSSQLMEEKELMHYLNWLRDQLKMPTNHYDQTVARNLQMMLRIKQYRARFAGVGGIDTIVEVLSDKFTSRQLQYQLIFCLWCMSFDMDHVALMYKNRALIPTVSDVLREADREKITRISLALFRSILEKLPTPADQRACGLSLVQCKVLRQLELLSQKDFSHDPELTEDMTYLTEKLTASIQDVSSLEEYTTELKSGRLEWSPVHKSAKFWNENAVKFTDNNYEILKMLVRLVELRADPLSLSVAVHDIGEFVRHYPRGKQVIENLGGKHLVMGLLQHEDPNVRYNALVSLQKIMVHNWEYLGRQLDSTQAQEVRSGDLRAK
ncbi:V-type proton ATPase subunit H [Paragonimus heterotremus]|uniref:V-type proton ATPase subunit H n=1 Tax=Paragonimus heterotremus TaxID=100268 RepID=A0A8J4SLE7_9TREM|nr:V-type proton ATPase subunit H [Paragonimus heterotremus]